MAVYPGDGGKSQDEDSQKELAERVAQRMSLRLGSLCGYVGE